MRYIGWNISLLTTPGARNLSVSAVKSEVQRVAGHVIEKIRGQFFLFSRNEEKSLRNAVVYRADGRSPSKLQGDGGFLLRRPNAPDLSIRTYVDSSTGTHISCSDTESAAKACLRFQFRFVYALQTPAIFIDVGLLPDKFFESSATVDTKILQQESEVASALTIPFSDVYAARRVILPAGSLGMYSPSLTMRFPDTFKPRGWAIRIPSKSSNEAERIENICREEGSLKQGERYLTFPEALELKAALEEQDRNYEQKNKQKLNVVVFDRVPQLTQAAAVTHIEKIYYELSQQKLKEGVVEKVRIKFYSDPKPGLQI
ncbi:MAG: hypothetical protein A3F14_04045 [Gammaproteobacteria bacterium RIFCSPHIGHO2_12_FULL_43_28]|nr:MAG: hypothetical protein A3F14_04045 [Gammaproteobacteria bacterium RIFCSPHIGHO2_12_FULL_43_28]